jgi:RHS repeat-associated protein
MTDHQGSTRGLISSAGSIISGTLINYDSFGKPSIPLPTRFQYTGREYDPDTKLYYYRARWYDPEARRFISEDPIGLNGGINLYGYVRNNPLNGTDPSGKIPVIFYVWAQGVIASPDTRFDIEMLSRNLGNREYGNAILDLAAIAIPGVSSLQLRAAKEGGKRIVCKIGGNAAGREGKVLTEAFHHTTSEFADQIAKSGLRPGSYATPTGGLSPLQAHIELALNPVGGARNAVLQVDIAGLRAAGYEIPQATRVTGQFGMAGGGWEIKFPYAVPKEFLKVITR